MAAKAGRAGRRRRPSWNHGALRRTPRFEREARSLGHLVVAGVDEAGRGALRGPVVTGAVVLGDGFDTRGLDESKWLTRRQLENWTPRIRERAVSWAVGCADREEIDRLSTLRATDLAMRRPGGTLRDPRPGAGGRPDHPEPRAAQRGNHEGRRAFRLHRRSVDRGQRGPR